MRVYISCNGFFLQEGTMLVCRNISDINFLPHFYYPKYLIPHIVVSNVSFSRIRNKMLVAICQHQRGPCNILKFSFWRVITLFFLKPNQVLLLFLCLLLILSRQWYFSSKYPCFPLLSYNLPHVLTKLKS